MITDKNFVIGVDYGTGSVRSVILNASNGDEISSSIFYYPRWKDGLHSDVGKNQFRQHPLDYVEGLEATIKDCMRKAGNEAAKNIKAISVDTIGSSPVAVDKHGTPLALLPEFETNPNAMFILLKDHTSIKKFVEINEHTKKFCINYLQYVGGIYSSEWFWAKLLDILRTNISFKNKCYSWIDHCNRIPFLLTGENDVYQMKHSASTAGCKAL